MAFLQKYRGQSLNVKPSCKVLSWSQLCNLAGKNEVTDRHQTIAKWLKNIGNKCSFFCVSEVSRDAESQGCQESGMLRVREWSGLSCVLTQNIREHSFEWEYPKVSPGISIRGVLSCILWSWQTFRDSKLNTLNLCQN